MADMNTTISVLGEQIEVRFELHSVHIFSDSSLDTLLRKYARTSTAELVSAIKSEYRKQFNTDFKVSNRSMSVEIWGHAYANQFAKWMKTSVQIKLVTKAAKFVMKRAGIIDIGEKGYDSNRIVWDCLAPFLSVIAIFLP